MVRTKDVYAVLIRPNQAETVLSAVAHSLVLHDYSVTYVRELDAFCGWQLGYNSTCINFIYNLCSFSSEVLLEVQDLCIPIASKPETLPLVRTLY